MTKRGWPSDWADKIAGKDCPMCAALQSGDSDPEATVFDGEFAVAHLERRSVLPGYCGVIWRHRHVAEPMDLDPTEAAGYWREVSEVARAIRAVFDPMKINLLTLGNWVPHLHTHVVPRYEDDPAAGGPIAWEAMFSEEPVPDEEIRRQASELRRLLGR